MKKAIKMLGVLSVLLLCTSVADAQRTTTTRTTTTTYDESEGNFAMRLQGGTLGGGGEAIMKLSDQLNGRLGANGGRFDYDGNENNIDYDFKLKLFTAEALLDWFPTPGGSFHFSGGAFFNDNEVEAEAKSAGSYNINGTTYTSTQTGTLKGTTDFNQVAPYLGIGWGNPFGKDSPWSMNLELGAFYQGEPDIELSASGPSSADPTFQANLRQEQEDLNDRFDKYQFYPVATIGIAYRF